MKEITSQQEEEIIKRYSENKTLREISREFEIDHHRVKRILNKNGISILIDKNGNIIKARKKEFSEEEKRKIVEIFKEEKSIRKTAKKLKHTDKIIKNILLEKGVSFKKEKKVKQKKDPHLKKAGYIAYRIGYDVLPEFYMQFEDLDKIIFLNNVIARKDRFPGGKKATEWYIGYINKFYYDEKFNKIYKRWKETKDHLLLPSIDHILPTSKGGTNELDNLRFVTFFENMAKNNIEPKKWEYVKTHLEEFLL